jgi:hypothetical protein
MGLYYSKILLDLMILWIDFQYTSNIIGLDIFENSRTGHADLSIPGR